MPTATLMIRLKINHQEKEMRARVNRRRREIDSVNVLKQTKLSIYKINSILFGTAG